MNQSKASRESGVVSQGTGRHRLGEVAIVGLETLLFATVLVIEIVAFFKRSGTAWPHLLIFALILSTPLPWLMGILLRPRAWKQTQTLGMSNPVFGYCRMGSAYLPLLFALLILLEISHA